jgi:hypothetical protein
VSVSEKDLLFPIAPEERDGQKKKPKKAKKAEPVVAVVEPKADEEDSPPDHGYLAKVDGHYECPQCGCRTLDLLDFRKVDGSKKWLLICSWNCLITFVVDPIPSILDKKPQTREFVVKTGRYKGTFAEIEEAGGGWWIDQVVASGAKTAIVAAARKFRGLT